jgi:hypothetical protein
VTLLCVCGHEPAIGPNLVRACSRWGIHMVAIVCDRCGVTVFGRVDSPTWRDLQPAVKTVQQAELAEKVRSCREDVVVAEWAAQLESVVSPADLGAC